MEEGKVKYLDLLRPQQMRLGMLMPSIPFLLCSLSDLYGPEMPRSIHTHQGIPYDDDEVLLLYSLCLRLALIASGFWADQKVYPKVAAEFIAPVSSSCKYKYLLCCGTQYRPIKC